MNSFPTIEVLKTLVFSNFQEMNDYLTTKAINDGFTLRRETSQHGQTQIYRCSFSSSKMPKKKPIPIIVHFIWLFQKEILKILNVYSS